MNTKFKKNKKKKQKLEKPTLHKLYKRKKNITTGIKYKQT